MKKTLSRASSLISRMKPIDKPVEKLKFVLVSNYLTAKEMFDTLEITLKS